MKLLLLTLAVLLLLSQLMPGNLDPLGEGQGVQTETWSRNPQAREDGLPSFGSSPFGSTERRRPRPQQVQSLGDNHDT